jgi:hypothetical protein
MQHRTTIKRGFPAAAFMLFLASAGCGGGGDDTATGGAGGTSGSAPMGGTGGSGAVGGMATSCSSTVTTSVDTNYKFSSTLTLELTKVKPSSEIIFDWSGVSSDFLGHPVNLADVGMIEIGLWKMGVADFEQKLNDDALAQSDLEIIATILPTPGQTTGSIFDLTVNGTPIQGGKDTVLEYLDITKYPPENHVYTVFVAEGTTPGKGTRMMHGFQLDAASSTTEVKVTSQSTALAYTADIASRSKLAVPASTASVTIDWTNMTTTAAGLPFKPQQITQIRVGKYTQSPAELEGANFLNLDTIAQELYQAEVTVGTKFDFSKTKTSSGQAFTGIDSSATWLVALNCGGCANPAPWYLSILEPCH